MKSLLSIVRTIFNLLVVVCGFIALFILVGVIDFPDIWYPVQNYLRL